MMSTFRRSLQRIECFWIRGIQGHGLSGSRMLEIEVGGVKRQTSNGIGSGAIVFVADNRMTGVGEMDPDLMLSSRLQPHFEGCCFSFPLQDTHVSYSYFSDSLVWR